MKTLKVLLAIAFFVVFMQSCKKDNPSGVRPNIPVGPTDPIKPTDPGTTTERNQLKSNAHIIDTTNVKSVSDNAVTILKTNTLSIIKPGDILIANPSVNGPFGFLRKVLSVSESTSEITCQTETSNLNDAFDQLNIDTTFYLSPETISANRKLGTFGIQDYTFKFSDENTWPGIKVSGMLKFNISSFQIKYKRKTGSIEPEKVLLKVDLNTVGSNIEITNSENSAVTLGEKLLDEIPLPPIPVPIPIPVYPVGIVVVQIPFYPKIELKSLPLTISGKAKWSSFPVISATLGAAYENSSWKNLSTFSINATSQPLSIFDFVLSSTLNANVKFATIEYNIAPYGVSALKTFFSLPNSFDLTIQPTTTPNYSLKYKLDVTGGVKQEFFTGVKQEYSITGNLTTKTILEGNWDSTLPKVSTIAAENITDLSASVGGIVEDEGKLTVSERGVFWSTNQNPTPLENKTALGTGLGGFSIQLIKLSPNVKYYVNTYAINSLGTAYGKIMSFTTKKSSYKIISNAGNQQTAIAGTLLPSPIIVSITDAHNNPIPNVNITWSIQSGGGKLSVLSSKTDQNGLASNEWTLGTFAGSQTCSATPDLIENTDILGGPITFIATAKQPVSYKIAAVASANNQIGYPNTMLVKPLQVSITDQNGKPVSGIDIDFQINSGGGSLAGITKSISSGIATALWTLGTSGTQSVVVRAKNPDGSDASGSGLLFNATFDNSTISIKGATYSWVRGRYGAPVPGNINYASPSNPPYYVYEPGQELAFGETLTVTAIGIPPAPNNSAGGYSYTVGSYQPDSLFISPGPGSNATNSYGHQFPEGWGWKLPPGYELKMYIYVAGQLLDNNIPSRISKDGLYIYRGYGGDMVYKKK